MLEGDRRRRIYTGHLHLYKTQILYITMRSRLACPVMGVEGTEGVIIKMNWGAQDMLTKLIVGDGL